MSLRDVAQSVFIGNLNKNTVLPEWLEIFADEIHVILEQREKRVTEAESLSFALCVLSRRYELCEGTILQWRPVIWGNRGTGPVAFQIRKRIQENSSEDCL